jgi:PAS domain S-box-containing protein
METVRHKVLIIEDGKVDQMAFQRFFKENDIPYDYTIVGSVAEAKTIFASKKFDILIADYLLGDGTAFDIFDLEIDAPIIVVTGSGSEEIAVKAMKAGAYDYLIKDSANNYLKVLPATVEKAIRRKREKEELRQYRVMVESAHDTIFFKDLNSRYIIANDKTLEAFGLSREEVIGKNDYDIMPNKEEAKKNVDDDQEVFKTGKPTESIKRMTGVEGKECWFQVIKGPHLDTAGNITGLIGVARDITERKQAEEERERLLKELEAKNRELERFTYTVSHDLRSPLVTIQGFTDMVQTDLAQNELERVADDLTYIENAATKMDQLLSGTLRLSRIGRIANPPEDVPFGKIVQDVLEQTAGEITSNNIEVSVADDFPTVHVDRMRIAEVLVNLIVNSINYRGEQPSPKIEIGHRIENGERVFFVQDNGIGMDKSEHEKVFDLFYQVDKSGKGMGAGLAIVKRIIEAHNGRIWIESEKGKGCTVCFTLPVV